MSRERIKKLKAVIKRLEAAIEPISPLLAICADETEEEVLKRYRLKDSSRVTWIRVFGSKKNGGPEDPVRPISSNSDLN